MKEAKKVEYERVVDLIYEEVEQMTLAHKLTMVNDHRRNISLDQALYHADEICQDVLLAKWTEDVVEFHHGQREHYVPQKEND